MRTLYTFFLFFSCCSLFAQNCEPPEAMIRLEGNNISATTSNLGDLFWSGGPLGEFVAPANAPDQKSTIKVAGLWIGSFDPAGNLKLAAQTDGRNTGNQDYTLGPLQSPLGTPLDSLCEELDQIWTVTEQDIVNHLADFRDNGMIDNPNPRIYAWPGAGNPHFESANGFKWPENSTATAPFRDYNSNRMYDPDQGDYPIYDPINRIEVFPNSMTWTVFNDSTLHTQSGGHPIQAEIGLLSWNFQCDTNEVLNNTIFTSYTITNRGIESISDIYIGLWVDFDLGCGVDDYIGSAPDQNAFFAYNADPQDGDGSSSGCLSGENTYGDHPPVQSVKFLDGELSSFIYYDDTTTTNPSPTTRPNTPYEYHYYLKGSWRDGTRITKGGSGYSLTSPEIVNHAFPDDPNDPNGWSMLSEAFPLGDRKAIGTYLYDQFGKNHLNPGESMTLNIAFTFHQREGLDHLSNVTQMYRDLEALQQMYNRRFEGLCQSNIVSAKEIIPNDAFSLSPNPTNGRLNLQLNELELDRLKIFDLQGRQLMEWTNLSGSMELDLGQLSTGMYLLRLESAGSVATRKVVRQ